MSLPYQYLALNTYLITRNTNERRFFLRPSEELRDAILYCIAHAQHKHRVLIHAFCAMSNHLHLVVTDPTGTIPAFVQEVHQNISHCVNHLINRKGAMWEGADRPNYCLLPKGSDAFDKVVYTLTNPVKAGIIPRHHLWPGAISSAAHIANGTMITQKPKFHFKSVRDPRMMSLPLVLTPVPGSAVISQEDYARLVAERVKAEEDRLAAEHAENGRSWMGRKACLALKTDTKPQTEWEDEKVKPTVASKSRHERFQERLRLRRFREKHKEAREAFRDGQRDVVFPAGTFFMRVYYGVATDPFP